MPALLTLLLLTQAPAPPPAGLRVDLGGEATLFVPEGYKPAGGAVDVLLHLHGAPSVVEAALVESGRHAVLIEFNRKGLSSAYAKPFSDPALFPRLLDGTARALKAARIAEEPRIDRVIVSSFSAGFGGVREMLKVAATYDRIDGLVLADSLYAGYRGDPKERHVDPDLMAGFRRYARDAADGRKAMLLTHSAQVPEGYASTAETADDLIAALVGKAEPTHLDFGPRLLNTRRFARGRLLILGFSGAGPDDHMAHLRGIARLWKALPDRSP